MKNSKSLIKILMIILLVISIVPILPYKFTVGINNSDYIMIKASYSSQFGLVAEKNYENLGIYKDMELYDLLEKKSFDNLYNTVTNFKNGLSGSKFNLYGKFIEDINGKKKFYIEKWSSPNVKLFETYIWKEKIKYIYFSLLITTIIVIIITILILVIKKERKCF
ncbi:hypothetical protein [Clostridium baratii]|uniref:hypothetical protein n=1 Tax=Clostridium baratii TaxID=1561 RepID=UPI00374EED48